MYLFLLFFFFYTSDALRLVHDWVCSIPNKTCMFLEVTKQTHRRAVNRNRLESPNAAVRAVLIAFRLDVYFERSAHVRACVRTCVHAAGGSDRVGFGSSGLSSLTVHEKQSA